MNLFQDSASLFCSGLLENDNETLEEANDQKKEEATRNAEEQMCTVLEAKIYEIAPRLSSVDFGCGFYEKCQKVFADNKIAVESATLRGGEERCMTDFIRTVEVRALSLQGFQVEIKDEDGKDGNKIVIDLTTFPDLEVIIIMDSDFKKLKIVGPQGENSDHKLKWLEIANCPNLDYIELDLKYMEEMECYLQMQRLEYPPGIDLRSTRGRKLCQQIISRYSKNTEHARMLRGATLGEGHAGKTTALEKFTNVVAGPEGETEGLELSLHTLHDCEPENEVAKNSKYDRTVISWYDFGGK